MQRNSSLLFGDENASTEDPWCSRLIEQTKFRSEILMKNISECYGDVRSRLHIEEEEEQRVLFRSGTGCPCLILSSHWSHLLDELLWKKGSVSENTLSNSATLFMQIVRHLLAIDALFKSITWQTIKHLE